MTNKLALATATAFWFGLAGFAIAADEAPGAHSDITIVQSTPGEKGDPAPPAASDDRNVNNKKDNEGSEGSSNKE